MTTQTPGLGYRNSKGVAQNKNADIQALTTQVTDAQYTVNELTNVVTSLTSKQVYFANLLTLASNKQASSLQHYNQSKALMADLRETNNYVKIVETQIGTESDTDSLSGKLNETAEYMAGVIDKLIFSVDIIEKLLDFVNRRKAVNEVIPDDLITYLNNAVTESNNAVSLTLTALESCYASITPVQEIEEISGLESNQMQILLALSATLTQSLESAYGTSATSYQNALNASNMANQQLEDAQAQLAEAQANLASLNAGLEAAKAAAFAA
ncbi:hypothetical protein [Pseudoalteromonas byunsanensis]|uniref:Chemotaxis protein n=1 Tax=Pseudoalteromonas byunsanensis TaxID=327939 RepID=A0A1S1N2C7_9GAMM|nr:hypothetical protein [Pseudoalteromonas byunsanensis]OHU93540.1 hypothetical protein BIW53_19545 [Pseudoalteromonas byunsanensis]